MALAVDGEADVLKRSLRVIVVGAATIAVSLLSLTAAEAVGLPPRLEVRHTTPAATADGMHTSAVVATTCGLDFCDPIHIQLTYVFVDEDGVTRYISVAKIVPAGGGTVDFVYPGYGDFVRITASQHWCERGTFLLQLQGSCGTSPATSEEIPVPAPQDLG